MAASRLAPAQFVPPQPRAAPVPDVPTPLPRVMPSTEVMPVAVIEGAKGLAPAPPLGNVADGIPLVSQPTSSSALTLEVANANAKTTMPPAKAKHFMISLPKDKCSETARRPLPEMQTIHGRGSAILPRAGV